MKNILRLLGLGLAALSLVFLTNCAQSSDVATYTDVPEATTVAATNSNYAQEVQAGVQYFIKGQVAAKPYSSVNAQQRGAIVEASYNFRDALIKARDILGIEA